MSATVIGTVVRTTEPRAALRRLLAVDSVSTGLFGLVFTAAPGAVGDWVGLDTALVRGLGVLLLALAALIGWTAGRERTPRPLLYAIAEGNLAWGAVSVVAGVVWLDLSPAAGVFVHGQALVVAAFGLMQWATTRRLTD